ncbi:hypothetical protein L596_018606 [Steinernema carpocapsae]|uniref:HORMA domain-containing protein n=1 Tax=Steinernema carpocapsae TaxID=34508 RepID=A0A4U5N5L8_STECR|nr:hypothetical protein L596_018606 [Steinernema carpocapsae]
MATGRRRLNARRNILSELERTADISALSQNSSGRLVATSPVSWISAVSRVLGSLYLHTRNIFPREAFEASQLERDGIENIPVIHEPCVGSPNVAKFLKVLDSLPELLRERKITELAFMLSPPVTTSDFAAEKFKILYVYDEEGVNAVFDLGGKRRSLSTAGMSVDTLQGLALNFKHMLNALKPVPPDYLLHITAIVLDEPDLTEESRNVFMESHGFAYFIDPFDQLRTPAVVLPNWVKMGDKQEVTMDVKLASVFASDSMKESSGPSFDD